MPQKLELMTKIGYIIQLVRAGLARSRKSGWAKLLVGQAGQKFKNLKSEMQLRKSKKNKNVTKSKEL